MIGAILFTAQSALLHPMGVVKTRMQVAGDGLAHRPGFVVFRDILRRDGVPGAFRGFGTSAVGSLPGRVLALTSLEVSKVMVLDATQQLDMPEATRIALANGVAGMVSNLVSCVYFVPLDVASCYFPLFGDFCCFIPYNQIYHSWQMQIRSREPFYWMVFFFLFNLLHLYSQGLFCCRIGTLSFW